MCSFACYSVDGALVAKKAPTAPRHYAISDVTNLEVMGAMQSLVDRKCAEVVFSWQWYYWTITEDGAQYLREFLGLEETDVPFTFKADAREEETAEKTQQPPQHQHQQQQQHQQRQGLNRGAREGGENRRPARPTRPTAHA